MVALKITTGGAHAGLVLACKPQKFLKMKIGQCIRVLQDAHSLAEMRASRQQDIDRRRRDGATDALTAHDEFMLEKNHKKHPLLDEIPISITIQKSSLDEQLYDVCIADPARKTPPIVVTTNDPKQAVDGFCSLLASEFADNLAAVLGDGASVRLFSYRVMQSAMKFRESAAVRPEKLSSPSEVRVQLSAIAETATELVKLMKNATESRALIEHSHDEIGRVAAKRKVLVKGKGYEKLESELAFSTRTSAFDWLLVRNVLEALAMDANHAACQLKVSRGRGENERQQYTPLSLIADAWLASFGKAPSSAERSRFSKVARYGLSLFSENQIALKRGLEYWKKTKGNVSQTDRMRGVNPALARR